MPVEPVCCNNKIAVTITPCEQTFTDFTFLCRLLPFGAGRRGCPGEVLARNRLFLIVACLAQKFTFEEAEEHVIAHKCDPRYYAPGLAIKPRPYKLRAIPREQQ